MEQSKLILSQQVQTELLNFFHQLFHKQAIRKNLYFFKYLTQDMQLPIKAIADQRKVAQILNIQKPTEYKPIYRQKKQVKLSPQHQALLEVLKKCPLVEVNGDKVKIKLEGDKEIVRLKFINELEKNHKKNIQSLIKDIKHQIHQLNNTQIQVQFQSNAAATEFIHRLQNKQQPDCQFYLEAKDPYQSIKAAINKLKKQRKTQTNNNYQHNYYTNNNQPYQNTYPNTYQNTYPNYHSYGQYQNYNNYYQTLQPFIRRAVESSDEEQYYKQQEGDGK